MLRYPVKAEAACEIQRRRSRNGQIGLVDDKRKQRHEN